MPTSRFDRTHKPPSVKTPIDVDPEDQLIRVVYGACDKCSGERPYGVPHEEPITDEQEYIDIVVFLDEVLEHCHFVKVQ